MIEDPRYSPILIKSGGPPIEIKIEINVKFDISAASDTYLDEEVFDLPPTDRSIPLTLNLSLSSTSSPRILNGTDMGSGEFNESGTEPEVHFSLLSTVSVLSLSLTASITVGPLNRSTHSMRY